MISMARGLLRAPNKLCAPQPPYSHHGYQGIKLSRRQDIKLSSFDRGSNSKQKQPYPHLSNERNALIHMTRRKHIGGMERKE
jgi:hypothetical protein